MQEIFLDCFMAFGPSINYLFQVFKFKNTKSSKGFSKYLCLITILSHTLKVFFWFNEKFKYTLLVQSILVIIMQLYLIFLCLKYQEKEINYNKVPKENDNNIENNIDIKQNNINWRNIFNYKLIWKWENILEYYLFYFFIIIILSIFSLCSKNNNHYSNIIGFVSIFLEMLCSFPQIIEMYRTKNQRNISKIMVSMWFIGNSIKVYYNISNNCPIQLIIGAYTQVFFNIILIIQIIYYYRNSNENELLMNSVNSNKIIFDVNSPVSSHINDNTD